MSIIQRGAVIARDLTAGLSQNAGRTYLLVQAATEVTITLDTGGTIVLPAGAEFEPDLVFTNAMTFVGTGTVVVNVNGE